MGRFEDKVVFITGAARGQGRSHAVRFASEGASIIASDICRQIESVPYKMSSREDLDETVALVEAAGGRIVADVADVRSTSELSAVLEKGLRAFGHVDVAVANAGIFHPDPDDVAPEAAWTDAIDVLLTGVYHTANLVAKPMIDRGKGGSIVMTSSTSGLKGDASGTGGNLGYAAAKHGVVGLMRSYARILAPHFIRVNSVHPTGVRTPMAVNDAVTAWFERGGLDDSAINAIPIDMIEPEDVSAAILWLTSDDARYVTGVTLPVDAGFLVR